MFLSGVTASLVLAAPAAAAQERPVVVYGEPESSRTQRVQFADLDLATGAGAKSLHARVGGAVRQVCLFEPSDKLQPGDYYRCASIAWKDARPQIANAVARSQALAATGQATAAAGAITVSAR